MPGSEEMFAKAAGASPSAPPISSSADQFAQAASRSTQQSEGPSVLTRAGDLLGSTIEFPFKAAYGALSAVNRYVDQPSIAAGGALIKGEGLSGAAQAAKTQLGSPESVSYRDALRQAEEARGIPQTVPLKVANAIAGTGLDLVATPSVALQELGVGEKAFEGLEKLGAAALDRFPILEHARQLVSTAERGAAAPSNDIRQQALAATRQVQEHLGSQIADLAAQVPEIAKTYNVDTRTLQGLIDAPKTPEAEALLAKQPEPVQRFVRTYRGVLGEGLGMEQKAGTGTFSLQDVINYSPQIMTPEFKQWLRGRGVNPNDPTALQEFFANVGLKTHAPSEAAAAETAATAEPAPKGQAAQVAKEAQAFTTQHAFQRGRLVQGAGVNDINDAVKAAYPDAPKALVDNPIASGLARVMATGKAIGGARYIDGVLATMTTDKGEKLPESVMKQFGAQQAKQMLAQIASMAKSLKMDPGALRKALVSGDPAVIDKLPESSRALAEEIGKHGALLDRYDKMQSARFSPEVVAAVNRYVEAMKPENIGPLLAAYDAYLQTWKGFTLAPIPAYHLRNMMSNTWQNYLAGLNNPIRYAQASLVQAGRPFKVAAKGKTYTTEDIAQLANDLGVTNAGFYGQEIDRSLQDTATQAAAREQGGVKGKAALLANKAKRGFGVVDKGFAAQRATENNARLALFIDRLAKGDTPEQAAKTVKKYLFDYSNLTPFEQRVMKRIFPFYTWSRFNIPLAVEAALTKPAKISGLQKLVDDINGMLGAPPDASLPDYARGRIYLGTNAQGLPAYGNLGGIISTQQLQDFGPTAGDAGRQVLSSLTPPGRAMTELPLNKQAYNNRPIEKTGGESSIAGTALPTDLVYLLQNLVPGGRFAGNATKAVQSYRQGEGPLTIAAQASGFNPFSPYAVNPGNTAYYRVQDLVRARSEIISQLKQAAKKRDIPLMRALENKLRQLTIQNAGEQRAQ